MKTQIINTLFEKYVKYSLNIVIKDSVEAEENETELSKENFSLLTQELTNKNYFTYLVNGEDTKADNILNECLKNYTEDNIYYENLHKQTNVDYYTLRTAKHLSIIYIKSDVELNMSSNEEILFKKTYALELEYYNLTHFHYTAYNKPLFSKMVRILIIFSTIMRLIKENQDLYITDQNINEYYLNNFLVSHGFLYYNNISHEKKKRFTKSIMNFYNQKGSLQAIEEMLSILNDKAVDIYEYYLYYDEERSKYYFLKVKPNESFITVYNELKSDREEMFNTIVDTDPSWNASESDLLNKNIKFIKSKYFSIDSFSDITDSNKELAFLINKMKRYRDVIGKTFKFDIDSFSTTVEIYDFIVFLTLLSMRINNFSLSVIKTITINENTSKFTDFPLNSEAQVVPNSKKELADLISESIQEIEITNTLENNIEKLKKEELFDDTYNAMDAVRIIRKKIKKNYTNKYRPISKDSNTTTAYDYLVSKYPDMETYLKEEDISLLSTHFLTFIDDLENILMLYGQSAFKFRDIYSNLYLPKILEIVNFFKSLNSYLLNFNNTLSIEREQKFDIIGDSQVFTGIIKISNLESSVDGVSGDPDYSQDQNYPNKEQIVDEEVDIGLSSLENNISTASFGSMDIETESKKNTIKRSTLYFKYIKPSYLANRKFSDFSKYTVYIDNESNIFDTEKRILEILENEDYYYLNGYIIDLYGASGSFKNIREKHDLSYKEFREKLKTILVKYNHIFGSSIPVTLQNNSSLLYEKVSDITTYPYIANKYLFRDVQSEIEIGDLLFVDKNKTYSFGDVVCILEARNGSSEYKVSDILNKHYRHTVVQDEKDIKKDYNEPHTGLRNYHAFIEELKNKNNTSKEEEEAIGQIQIPDLDFIPELPID